MRSRIRDRIVLNENTMRSTNPYEADKPDAYKCLPEVREKLFAGEVVIGLLPALPKTWADGKISGLRARGDFTVDIEWKAGRVTKAVVRSGHGTKAVVRLNGETRPLALKAGESAELR